MVLQLIDTEFKELKQHVASLEARCVTEDFQDYQARIDRIIEDIATWQTEHSLGEDQIKALQETGRLLYDQDKAYNDEIEKLKARIDDEHVDIQDIAQKHKEINSRMAKLNKEVAQLHNYHNLTRGVLVNIGALCTNQIEKKRKKKKERMLFPESTISFLSPLP